MPPWSHSLWKNHIGDVGAAAFGEALKANSTLVTLECALGGGERGCMRLLCGIVTDQNGRFTHSLWRNRIGDVGAMAIGEALKTNSKLKTL